MTWIGRNGNDRLGKPVEEPGNHWEDFLGWASRKLGRKGRDSMDRVLIINNEGMGQGDVELGNKLMGAFLRKVWASPDKPEAILLYNSGVKLAAKGSDALGAMVGLFEAGVDILACGTCVEHYRLKDDMVAARISNMEEIASILLTGTNIVTV